MMANDDDQDTNYADLLRDFTPICVQVTGTHRGQQVYEIICQSNDNRPYVDIKYYSIKELAIKTIQSQPFY